MSSRSTHRDVEKSISPMTKLMNLIECYQGGNDNWQPKE